MKIDGGAARVLVHLGVAVPLAEGHTSRADVFGREEPPAEGMPALLAVGPYGRNYNVPTMLGLVNPIRAARAGFAVVLASSRGTAGAPGVFRPFRDEAVDTARLIEWCRAQPWSDGRVVMWGPSYLGAAQLIAAAASVEGLVGVVPVFTSARVAQDWAADDRVIRPWRSALLASGALDESVAPDVESLRTTVGEAARTPSVAAAEAGHALPGLYIAGWHDTFVAGTVAAYVASPHPLSRLIVGPWSHRGYDRVVGEVDFGEASGSEHVDLAGRVLAFARSVTGHPNPRGANGSLPVAVFVFGSNRWLAAPGWPVTDARATLELTPCDRRTQIDDAPRLPLATRALPVSGVLPGPRRITAAAMSRGRRLWTHTLDRPLLSVGAAMLDVRLVAAPIDRTASAALAIAAPGNDAHWQVIGEGAATILAASATVSIELGPIGLELPPHAQLLVSLDLGDTSPDLCWQQAESAEVDEMAVSLDLAEADHGASKLTSPHEVGKENHVC